MTTEMLIPFAEQAIMEIIAGDPALFIVQIKVKPGNNIKIFLDGDNGITIETCIKINRALYRRIEEDGIFPDGDFSLEVSSPGVGESLLLRRQYVKNISRFVLVKTNDGEETEGELKSVEDQQVTLEVTSGKGKKLEKKNIEIPFDNIKSTTVQIKF